MNDHPQNIVILSGDISGPMTAAYLARHLPRAHYAITLVSTQNFARSHWCASAHYDIRRFNKALGLGEADFIKSTRATFNLGDHYTGFSQRDYYSVYGDYGITLGGSAFYHGMAQMGRFAPLPDLEDYCLPAKAARLGRFLPPDSKGRPVLSDYRYGYHMNVEQYGQRLVTLSENYGVSIIDASLQSVEVTGDRIKTITLSNGRTLSADLFIDCSGPDSLLSSHQKTREFEDWSQWGFAQSVNQSVDLAEGALPAATEITAHDNGWVFSAALQNETQTLAFNFAPDANSGAVPIQAGRQREFWVGNVIALGTSAATIEPRFGATLRMIQLDIERLIKVFPPQLENPIERSEFNRQTRSVYDRLRDFQILHYKTTKAQSRGWEKRRNIVVPDTAAFKLDLFKARGRIAVLDDDDLFLSQYISVFLGQELIPQRIDAMTNALNTAQAERTLSDMKKIIDKAVFQMPLHADFIRRNCAAEDFAYV